MTYCIQCNYGDISVTLQESGEYNPMVATDMIIQARDGLLSILAGLPDVDDADELTEAEAEALTHYQAMRRDVLQEDE